MISVIIGIHRLDKFSTVAIDSILAQEGVPFEPLIICNGKDALQIKSTLSQYYKKENHIKWLHSPVAQLSHALNIGIAVSFVSSLRWDTNRLIVILAGISAVFLAIYVSLVGFDAAILGAGFARMGDFDYFESGSGYAYLKRPAMLVALLPMCAYAGCGL